MPFSWCLKRVVDNTKLAEHDLQKHLVKWKCEHVPFIMTTSKFDSKRFMHKLVSAISALDNLFYYTERFLLIGSSCFYENQMFDKNELFCLVKL